jgi:hypothetical protein
MKYTTGEVRAIARRLHDDITVRDGDTLTASDMLTAYAERIEADEGAVTDDIARKAYAALETEGDQIACMRKALLAVWPSVPAQAAQVDSANWFAGKYPTTTEPAQPTDSGRVIAWMHEQASTMHTDNFDCDGPKQNHQLAYAIDDAADRLAALTAQVQGEAQPYGYVYQAPEDDPVFEYAADRWSERLRYSDHVETPVYAASPAGVPDGLVLVPVEPTEAMQTAHHIYGDTSDWWSAVIAAAPSAPEGESHE